MNLLDMDLEQLNDEFKKSDSRERERPGKEHKVKKDKKSKHSKKEKKYKRSYSPSLKKQKHDKHKKKLSRSRSNTQRKRKEENFEQELHQNHPLYKRKDLEEEEDEERKRRQLEEWKKKMKQQEEEIEQMQREEQTVQVSYLPNFAKEKDIYKFLNYHNVGTIRDIKLIKDHHSGKSKGVAYVEFWKPESIVKALQLSSKPFNMDGKDIDEAIIQIRHSQAQVNWAAAQHKQVKEAKLKEMSKIISMMEQGPTQVYIGGLIRKLDSINEIELKDLFAKIGRIESVDIPKDPKTKKNRGYAIITYCQSSDANRALDKMNGFKLSGESLKVTAVSESMLKKFKEHQSNQYNDFEDTTDKYTQKRSTINKQKADELRNKLAQKEDNKANFNKAETEIISGQTVQLDKGIIPSKIPTCFVLMANMFSGDEIKGDKMFFIDMQEDVENECKNFGDVKYVLVDKKSNSGNIWIQYENLKGAMSCQNMMNSRNFNERKIFCCFVTEFIFNQFTKPLKEN